MDSADDSPCADAGERRALAQMVETQLERRGIRDPRVLAAMRAVPRARFVPAEQRARAYDDGPIPIGHGATISQPYVVGWMCELLQLTPGARVLEIGTGSGYHAAVLAACGAEVHSVENVPALAARARARLQELGYEEVVVHTAEGREGWAPAAPYDAILLTAAPREVPPKLLEQLAPGARLVAPVGDPNRQQVVRLTKSASGMTREALGAVRFVPFTREAAGAHARGHGGERGSSS